MTSKVTYRQFQANDRENVYALFRTSIFDYVRQIGMVDPDDVDDIPGSWQRQGPLMIHLEKTAHQDCVAELDGRIVGWGRSVERGGHLQLTHFFVDPSMQGQGVGRGILERAFPRADGMSRSILATQNPLALSLYLRSGVAIQGTSVDLHREARDFEIDTRIVLEETPLVDEVRDIDRDVMGFDRTIDLEFLASDRPLYACRRGMDVVGYAFGMRGAYVGPVGVREARDLQPVVALLEARAARDGHSRFGLTVPTAAHDVVRWCLDNDYRIQPFYEMLLFDSLSIALDHYVMTQPSFIW